MMVEPKKNKSIEELLNSVVTYWICPITGIHINSNNTAEIESHKQKLIQQEKEKEVIRQRDKALDALYKEYPKISSLKDLNEYIRNVISLKDPTLPQENMPTLSVKAMKFTSNHFLTSFDSVPVKIIGLTPETKKMFKNNLSTSINAENKGEVFYMIKRNANPLAQSIHAFYVKASSNKLVTVGVKEKELLAEHPEYPALLKELQTIKDGLHDLKLQHAQVDGRMAQIRKEVLNSKAFIDPPSKNEVSSTQKMKR